MAQQYLYFVFSSTHNLIGKAIRKVTKEEYNHVSIALDENLEQMYGFARRYYRTPLYGGFIRESQARFCVKDKVASVRVCRLPVTSEQYAAVKNRLEAMYPVRHDYIYNHLSALTAMIHKNVKVKNAYTCVEFAVEILEGLGVDVQKGKYYSVCNVMDILSDYHFYAGPMPQNGQADAEFFSKRPVPFPTLVTLREILKLIPRLGK